MKINSIKCRKHDLRLSRPYTIAFMKIDSVESGIVEISSDTGLTGYGAFNPAYEVIGETIDQALNCLTDDHLGQFIGEEISDLNSFNTILAEIRQQFSDSASARIGLEIAIYDLFTQSLRLPLSVFLGQKIFSMPTSITVGISSLSETLAEAEEYIGRKFRILKVKVGISPEEDVERLVKIRERFGNTVGLIVDMNQGYGFEKLDWFLGQTKSLDVRLIEQPFKRGEEFLLRTLEKKTRDLVAADESLISSIDASELVKPPRACGFFNIKLMKCGGVNEALNIAEIAGKGDIGLMWGCNSESIISITAALHIAFSCGNTKFIDLDGSFDLEDDVVKGGFILKDGIMSIASEFGLGVSPV
ncbi:MAG TPA: dipeptide epimerase [Puia sp.]|nr:dipeptide epimerase [Puia sp.]